jgi:hypothetical protein
VEIVSMMLGCQRFAERNVMDKVSLLCIDTVIYHFNRDVVLLFVVIVQLKHKLCRVDLQLYTTLSRKAISRL